MVVDLFLVYQFIRRLATPFEKWDAYKEGVIDKDGKVIVDKKDRTPAQKKSWKTFDVMIANIKKLLAKVPGGSSRLASYAAALYLIREWNHFSNNSLLTEDVTEEQINESLSLFSEAYLNYTTLAEAVNPFDEEIANNVGSGNIAGMDGGHMSKEAQKRWTKQNKSKKKIVRAIIGKSN